jgi:hypothetical protein
MTQIVAVARATKNVLTATDPNDFIFHSSYNTLKIIASAVEDILIPANTPVADYTVLHGLEQIPFMLAFMREEALSEVVFQNNQTGDASAYLTFESFVADYTQLIFRIANSHPTLAKTAHIRYILFEIPI